MPTFTLSRSRTLAVLGVTVAAVLAIAHFVLPPVPAAAPAPAPAAATPAAAGAAAGAAAATTGTGVPTAAVSVPSAVVVVDVTGAVRRPGLYRLTQGARVADALARAGGATPKADLPQVNLAALVADGEQIVVPRRGAAPVAAAGAATGGASSASSSGPVHLNSATAGELDALPGVGPVTAQKIVDYRQAHGGFASVDELDAIPGIGPKRLDDLRELVAP